jgi:hypothetical protein
MTETVPAEDDGQRMAIEERRRRTAHHEAGHLLGAALFLWKVEAVSIRPGESFNGICHYGDLTDLHVETPPTFALVPSLDLPEDFRKSLERRIVVSLMGQLAAQYAVPMTGFIPAPAEDFAESAAKALARLSPRHAELVVAAERREPIPDDEENAWAVSSALVGDAEAAHLQWLRVVADQLVREWMAEIEALAEALLVSPVLSGDEAKRIIREVRPYRWRTAADAVPA